MPDNNFTLEPIGVIHSELVSRENAPRQGYEGAPEAWLEIDPAFEEALHLLSVGDAVIILTWFHQADRTALQVHPRNMPDTPLTGVFATRSPDRPNPIGLHRVTILEIDGLRLKIAPIEAIDGTPVIDIKPVLGRSDDQ